VRLKWENSPAKHMSWSGGIRLTAWVWRGGGGGSPDAA
jgi:hypothetical protein